MPDYSKHLRERFSNRGPKVSYSAICRERNPLGADHVQPKNCGNIDDSVLTDVYGPSRERPRKQLPSQRGSHFRTIRGYCTTTRLGSDIHCDAAMS